jgi:hypothetical protein
MENENHIKDRNTKYENNPWIRSSYIKLVHKEE